MRKMPYYKDTPKNQDQLKYWMKRKTVDLGVWNYCVHTIRPEYVVNTHARLYFEDLEATMDYFNKMIDKGIYAVIEDK